MSLQIQKIEKVRKRRIKQSNTLHKHTYGQYITPLPVAKFMSDIIPTDTFDKFKILDPGAGIGSLSLALLNSVISEKENPEIEIDCFEIDKTILPHLYDTFKDISNYENVKIQIYNNDFILDSVIKVGFNTGCDYTHIIMNPPYKKINSNSQTRSLLSGIGIETVNLYSAFLALSIYLLADNGYICAIVPRSFCNGLYYLPFREFLLKNTKIRRLHLFESRTSAFKEESVLQENIIILLQKSTSCSDVVISKSNDASFSNYHEFTCKYDNIINPADKQKYINIPNNAKSSAKCSFSHSIENLGLSVSTGPIVDFRVKDYLENDYKENLIPLIYPIHLKDNRLIWPLSSKRPNAIRADRDDVKKSLYPKGNYILVRRFSSKEEKKRIVASLITENDFVCDYIAVENHLNVIHKNKHGMDLDLAYGIMNYLNSNYFDEAFRQFSGHTQVNSTDLRNMKYPSAKKLKKIGRIAFNNKLDQEELEKLLFDGETDEE